VGRIAMEIARRPADTVARFGGDEFAIVLPETPAAAAAELSEKLRERVMSESVEHAGNTPRVVTVSVGCATVVPEEGGAATELMAAADAALYEAKRGGRNRVESAVHNNRT